MSEGLELTRSLAGLLVVLALLGLFVWLARRGTLSMGARGRGATPIRIESAVPLGDRRSLMVVAVEGRRLLLGLTPGQVSLVAELQAPARPFESSLDRSIEAGRGQA